MSLIEQLGEGKKNLPTILMRYENGLDDVEANLAIKGKMLEQANIEQAAWQAYYDQSRIELYSLMKFMEADVARIRGKLWISYTETHTRDLGPRDKDQYINNETAYLDTNELFLEVQELYKKYEAIVDAFRSRGFALNNITKIRISQMEDVTL